MTKKTMNDAGAEPAEIHRQAGRQQLDVNAVFRTELLREELADQARVRPAPGIRCP